MYILIVTILVAILILPEVIKCLDTNYTSVTSHISTNDNNKVNESFYNFNTDPKNKLVWIQGKGDQYHEKGLIWETPTAHPKNHVTLLTECKHEKLKPCSKKNNCKKTYGDLVYQRCLSKGGDSNQCNCCGYCNCVSMGGDLTRCLDDTQYQDCLRVNHKMYSPAAVSACRIV